jgi:hypothetical protein
VQNSWTQADVLRVLISAEGGMVVVAALVAI